MENSNEQSKVSANQCAFADEIHNLLCVVQKKIENTGDYGSPSRSELLEYLACAKVSALRWALETFEN